MNKTSMENQEIDTTDVDRWMGQPVGGEQLRDPVNLTDQRRWVQAMHNPNPLYYDTEFARTSVFGRIVPPQSFILACAIRHGVPPSTQGTIPGARQMNGGDEWWFGSRVSVGDVVTSVRRAFDYRITTTKFAGPTIFQRGDTTYLNQRGEMLARQRSTAIRFLATNLKVRAKDETGNQPPDWPAERIALFEKERLEYARVLHERPHPSIAALQVGDRLARRPIGPHSIQSFTTEQRAFLYTMWGNLFDDGLPCTARVFRAQDAALDPSFGDGLYHGASAGHTDSEAASLRGMPRAYGAGAALCAYVIDYVTNWAGERGSILHSSISYRSPVLVGDGTYINGSVSGIEFDSVPESGIVILDLETTALDGQVLSRGTAKVRLPMSKNCTSEFHETSGA